MTRLNEYVIGVKHKELDFQLPPLLGLPEGSPACHKTQEDGAFDTHSEMLPYAIATKRLRQTKAFMSSLESMCSSKLGLERELV